MPRKARSPSSLDGLVERMFDQVLEKDERAELLTRIREWEAAHPDVDPAHRVTAWIDLAYELQAPPLATPPGSPVEPAERAARVDPGWTSTLRGPAVTGVSP